RRWEGVEGNTAAGSGLVEGRPIGGGAGMDRRTDGRVRRSEPVDRASRATAVRGGGVRGGRVPQAVDRSAVPQALRRWGGEAHRRGLQRGARGTQPLDARAAGRQAGGV